MQGLGDECGKEAKGIRGRAGQRVTGRTKALVRGVWLTPRLEHCSWTGRRASGASAVQGCSDCCCGVRHLLAADVAGPSHSRPQEANAHVSQLSPEDRQQLVRHLKAKWGSVNTAYQVRGRRRRRRRRLSAGESWAGAVWVGWGRAADMPRPHRKRSKSADTACLVTRDVPACVHAGSCAVGLVGGSLGR